jgi:hypothetical protein
MSRWISYILAIIVSVQAFAAAADVHQPHQPEKEHLEFYKHKITVIDSEQSSKNPNNQFPGNSTTTALDCHHHCHSCHNHILIRNSLATQSLSYDVEPIGYVNLAQIGVLSQPYRPPRV